MILVLVVVGAVAISLLVTSWLIRKGRAETEQRARPLRQIASLSLPEAERRALEALSAAELFRCLPADAKDSPDLGGLADGIKRLFGRYRRVQTARGPALRLDRECLALSSARSGFILIGKGMEATDVEFDLAVRPGAEAVYELYPNGEPPDPTLGTYASVYHWILAAASEVTDADRKSGRNR